MNEKTRLYKIVCPNNSPGLFFGKTYAELKKYQDEYLGAWLIPEASPPPNGYQKEYEFENQAFWIIADNGLKTTDDIFIPVRYKPQFPPRIMSEDCYEVQNALTGATFWFGGFTGTMKNLQLVPTSKTEAL